MKPLIRVCVLAAATLWLPLPANAIQSGTLGASPTSIGEPTRGWFDYRLRPGQQLRDSIEVRNDSSEPISLRVYAVDAAPLADGGFGMAPPGQKHRDVGGWVSLDQSHLNLAAHSRQTVRFTLATPDRPAVGNHYGGIVLEPETTVSAPGPLRVVSRLGVRIYVHTPGKPHSLMRINRLALLHLGRLWIAHLDTRNSGNTLLIPSGHIAIRPLVGRPRIYQVSSGRTIQPGESIGLDVPLHLSWPEKILPLTVEANIISSNRPRHLQAWLNRLPLTLLTIIATAGLSAWLLRRGRGGRA